MVMDAVGSAASAVGEALGLLKPDKAKIVCTGDNLPSGLTEIECMFNPTEYRLTQTLNVTRNQTPQDRRRHARVLGHQRDDPDDTALLR